MNHDIVAAYDQGNITLHELALGHGIPKARVVAIIREAREAEKKQMIAAADSIDDLPVTVLDLPVRAANALKSLELGVTTIGDAKRVPDAKLLRIPNFGRTSLRALRAAIAAFEEGAA